MSYIYFLFFAKESAFKVGKADCIKTRLSQLSQYWGECCLSKSFAISIKSEDVFKAESFAHAILHKYKYTPDKKEDGYTEFFRPPTNKVNDLVEYLKSVFGEITVVDIPTTPDEKYKKIVRFGKNPFILMKFNDKTSLKIVETISLPEKEYNHHLITRIALTFDLKSAGIKAFNVLIWLVQNYGMNTDIVTIDSITLDEFNQYHEKKLSLTTLKRGLNELEGAKIIAKAARRGSYYINPNFVFNGNRIVFSTCIERKER